MSLIRMGLLIRTRGSASQDRDGCSRDREPCDLARSKKSVSASGKAQPPGTHHGTTWVVSLAPTNHGGA